MKNLIYFLFVILALSLFSCQKDSDANPDNPSSNGPRIKTENYQGSIDTYTYDERGRVVKEVYADSASAIIEYYKGYFIEKEYNPQGNLTNLRHFELNADSLVETFTQTVSPDYETHYEYDSQRRLVLATSIYPGNEFIEHNYYGPGGNKDSSVYTQNGIWLYTYAYTYLEHQSNVYSLKIYGRIYEGEESKNLLAGAFYRFPNPVNNDVIQYDYVFDSQGRIITMTERVNGISEQYDYTY